MMITDLLRITGRWLPLIAMVSCFSACTTSGPDDPPSNVIFPASQVSYSAHVLPFFEGGCAYGGCHDGGTAGAPNFLRYIDLFSEPGLVLPGDTAGSKLCQVLALRLPHSNAPIDLYANVNQRQGVIQWVLEGASNN